jgi:hypothetical protein
MSRNITGNTISKILSDVLYGLHHHYLDLWAFTPPVMPRRRRGSQLPMSHTKRRLIKVKNPKFLTLNCPF